MDPLRRHDGAATLRQKQRVAFAAALIGRHNVAFLRGLALSAPMQVGWLASDCGRIRPELARRGGCVVRAWWISSSTGIRE